MKKLFVLFALAFCLTNLKAQYVTITDTAFVNWLQTNIPSSMNGNQMDTTSLAVTTRTNVNVSPGNISDLTEIKYFSSLKELNCSYNNITSLPNITSALEYLDCQFNQITNLSNLPNTLIYLNCNYNLLTNLSSLPNSIEILICGHNQLTTLSTLPNSLKILNCETNLSGIQLVSILSLPPQLDSLELEGHNLSSLPTLP